MRKTAALHNLGCKVNAYETEAMRQLLEEAGYEIVPFTERADVYVINTCSVTNMADRKSRQMVHRARALNPDAVVVAAGCYVQAVADADVLGADIVIGNNKKHELVSLLNHYFLQREKNKGSYSNQRSDNAETVQAAQDRIMAVNAVIDINDRSEQYEDLAVAQPAEHTRAFVKVQDGCNQFCSYCIIPYVRGRARSRSMESILAEVRTLAARGYQEIVLTGIHLSSYGLDLLETSEDNMEISSGTVISEEKKNSSLLDLIHAVAGVDGIARIRLGSLEPKIITEDFVRTLSAEPKICPHFHLSLQSGCDATLQRMNRHYTTEEYEAGCNLLRRHFDRPAITTDVIVGFPGETEEEFAQTREFLQRIHFYEMHIFKYSKRQGTRAAQMPDQVPEPVKTRRSAELLALAKQMSAEYREASRGRRISVLFEEPAAIAGETYYTGFTPEYIRVAAPSLTPLTNHILQGYIGGQLSEDIYHFKETL